MKRSQMILVPALALALVLLGVYWFAPLYEQWRVYVLLAAAACTLVVFLVLFLVQRHDAQARQQLMDNVFSENAGTARASSARCPFRACFRI